MKKSLAQFEKRVHACRACPRLVKWREQVAREKRKSYKDQKYWGKPVAGFGDADANVVLIGLAPGAHGANRTGRIFTGDHSGDFLFAALHRVGCANQKESVSRKDGLVLEGMYISVAVRCVPPDNKPERDEIEECAHFLDEELELLPNARTLLALGTIAWRASLDFLKRKGIPIPKPMPAFGHGATFKADPYLLIGSYHVSAQNTLTGMLTPAMFDRILRKALGEK